MASSKAIWGIDIGQCALKALRCVRHDDDDKIVADAFDYIEYPKILSQPEADPVELVRDALTQFLSRNSVKGDRVAISVPGQNGLARFVKLPPVESKKIPDIVRFEAKQQIPFALEDVVWDFQRMAGGSEEDGFALETEVGLFAMKREQVFRVLKPFQEADIEVDVIQLSPLAVYNYVVFDMMQDLPPADQYDPESPPDSTVVLAMGTDATDLVVTNGYRVWQRSVPLGGNHFTKALTKELKLTFAKAEHVKRNASHADDAKAVFQAMRPVFSDLVTEVQRSISYFTNIDRRAKIGRIVALGNGMKLPGLQRFLSQNLGIEVERVETFRGLVGPEVLDAPSFKENVPAFGVCYGLALQGLRDVRIATNLIPQEMVQERIIREKKPWAVAAAALLMGGLLFSFGGSWRALNSVHDSKFGAPMTKATNVGTTAGGYKTAYQKVKTDFASTETVGANLRANIEGRLLWLEVLRAINLCLPSDPPEADIEDIHLRNQLRITSVECQKIPKLEDWWTTQQSWYQLPPGVQPPAAATVAAGAPAAQPASPAAAGAASGPSGPGWIFRLTGHHYHNKQDDPAFTQGAEFVRRTLLKNLHQPRIAMLGPDGQPAEDFPVGELGISHAMIVQPGPINMLYEVVDENAEPMAAAGDSRPMSGGRRASNMKKQPRFDFVVEFVWVETPPSKRAAVVAAAPAAGAADAAAVNPAAPPPGVPAAGAPAVGAGS